MEAPLNKKTIALFDHMGRAMKEEPPIISYLV
jgi:hypothetical protein